MHATIKYSGRRKRPGDCEVLRHHADGSYTLLSARLDLVNHSPTGFEWGYPGSGPAQLAFAILMDHYGRFRLASRLYQTFKARFLAPLEDNEWELVPAEIDSILSDVRPEAEAKLAHYDDELRDMLQRSGADDVEVRSALAELEERGY